MLLSLLQVWVYQHFRGMRRKDIWAGYREDRDPHTMLFVPLSGLATPHQYINHLDPTGVVIHPYRDHRQACQFKRVSLYSG